jgi:hypothetical protein
LDRAKEFRDIFNRLTRNAKQEELVQEKFIAHLRQFYISLNNPTYINGWLNRVNALNEFTYASLRAVRRNWKKLLVLGTGMTAFAVGVYFLVDYLIEEEKTANEKRSYSAKEFQLT